MHKKPLKRSTFNPSTQKIKAPQHLSRVQDYEDRHSESNSRFQLPSLLRKKCWKDAEHSATSWDQSSTATSVSWSPEMEDVATSKLVRQWEAIERTLYDEDEQVSQTSILEECIQWRTQTPHLRVIGKSLLCDVKNKFQDLNINNSEVRSASIPPNDETLSDYSHSAKERGYSLKNKNHRSKQDEVIEIMVAYVISELFPNKENESDSLHNDLNDVLKICPAPVYSNKSSAKSDVRFSSNVDKKVEDRLLSIKREAGINSLANQRKYENGLYSSKSRGSTAGRSESRLGLQDRLYRPQTGRNKLGTVFNEKIVVSPVPYVLSTKESFSTLRTTPIKFMGQSLDVSALQGRSGRNISALRNLTRNSSIIRATNGQSAWHAPVCPTVWPKNIKLAPIDTSRLPSSKTRSVAPPSTGLQRNRKSLSPIVRSTLPVSAHSICNSNDKDLEIQGKHIVPGQSPKLSLLSPRWDYTPRKTKSRKKKSEFKN